MTIGAIGSGDFYLGQRRNDEFEAFVQRQYGGIPDRTTTIDQKKRAIAAKKRIIAHPQCPSSSKPVIKNEISKIESEIIAMQRELAMNSSIFTRRNNLG